METEYTYIVQSVTHYADGLMSAYLCWDSDGKLLEEQPPLSQSFSLRPTEAQRAYCQPGKKFTVTIAPE